MSTIIDSMLRVVLRPIEAGGGRLVAGQVVDTDGWRNRDPLERQRYLAAVPVGATPIVAEDGRLFIDVESAEQAGAKAITNDLTGDALTAA